MKVISFDIGIKNMAYCILSIDEQGLSIYDWAVLNLSSSLSDDLPIKTCNCLLKSGKKQCGKKATYYKNDQLYCNKHAKEQTQWILSVNVSYKKMKIAELREYASTLFSDIQLVRPELIKQIDTYIESHRLIPIIKPKKISANDEELITIAKQMTEQFDNIPGIDTVNTWIIENQMTAFGSKTSRPTGSVRMKVIQGFVAQYAIMKSRENHVEFISPKNKLKGLALNINGTEKEIYKQHKIDSVQLVRQFLNVNESLRDHLTTLELFPKRDDICDTLLQGIWWLQNNHYITYDSELMVKLNQ